MGGWTGIGKDRINWGGQIEQGELNPSKENDLITKFFLDTEIATINQTLVDDYLPYTGATGGLDIGAYEIYQDERRVSNTIDRTNSEDMIAYWQMEGNVEDSFSNHDGTGWPGGGTGLAVGNCAKFEENDGPINVSDDGTLDLSGGEGFTIEFWTRHDVVSPTSYLLNKANYNVQWVREMGPPPSWKIESTVNGVTIISDALDTEAGYFVVLTYDGTTLYLYINGVLVDSDALASSGTSSDDLEIGEDFIGLIDEVALYTSYFSESQILAHYHKMLDNEQRYNELSNYWVLDDDTYSFYGDVNISGTTYTNTLDLGTNTITDGNMTGDWDFGSGDLTTTGEIHIDADSKELTLGADEDFKFSFLGARGQIDFAIPGIGVDGSDFWMLTGEGGSWDGATAGRGGEFAITAGSGGGGGPGATGGDGGDILMKPGNGGTGFVSQGDGGSVRFLTGTGATAGVITFGNYITGNYTEMDDGGFQEAFGDAIAYKDLNIGGYLLTRPTSGAPDIVNFLDEAGADTAIPTYAFAIGEKVSGGFELQHDYAEGTDLVFHVHWEGIAAPTGTDNVQWRLTYILMRGGETLNAAVTIDSPDTIFDTQYETVRTDFAAITGTNFKIGDQFMFTLERVAATGDAYAGDALIGTAGIHYQVNTIGSRTITTK